MSSVSGLNDSPQIATFHPLRLTSEVLLHGVKQNGLLGIVHGHDAVQDLEVEADLLATLVQGLDVFGEAASTVPDA